METTAMSHHIHSLSLSIGYLNKFHRNHSMFTCNELDLYKVHVRRLVLQPHSSSSSYSSLYCSHIVHVSSSGAEFPGQLLDDQAKRMKTGKRIAGIEQDGLVEDLTLLADPDSCFCEFKGVKLHHKICDPELSEKDESLSSRVVSSRVGLPMILLHGFGASLFSWSRVMKGLAWIVGSKVLAFDRPAFGLTSRLDLRSRYGNGDDEKKLNPYSTAFSVLATLHFIELLGAEKAILVGHSAGSFVAVKSYFEAPERVAALILVCPAILAPLTIQREYNTAKKGDDEIQEDSSSMSKKNPFYQFCSALFKLVQFLFLAITQAVKSIVDIINSLYKKVLKTFLQSAFAVALIRMFIDKFGIMAVKLSWYNSNLCTDQVLSGYTKPLRAKGWDKALVEYTAALLTDTASESKPPLWQRLHEISCPVLIVTGDSDRIVPAWNAERLARAIPGSSFEVIKQCGHLPQEEKPDEFIAVVQKFLQRTLSDSPAQP